MNIISKAISVAATVAILALAFGTVGVASTQSVVTVDVTVKRPDGTPVAGVTIQDVENNLTILGSTNASGQLQVTVEVGHHLRATDQFGNVETVVVSSGTTNITIVMDEHI